MRLAHYDEKSYRPTIRRTYFSSQQEYFNLEIGLRLKRGFRKRQRHVFEVSVNHRTREILMLRGQSG